MVTLFITAVLLLSLFAVAVYLWQKPANKSENIELPPVIAPTSLFPTPTSAPTSEDETVPSFLARAQKSDFTVLVDARNHGAYPEVIDAIVKATNNENTIHKLAAFITENDLPASRALVDALTASWEVNPDRQLTIQLLHVTALANDAQIYDATITRILRASRGDKRLNISNSELLSLINSHYWLLSSSERSSATGFILKRTLSSLRRELESTNT